MQTVGIQAAFVYLDDAAAGLPAAVLTHAVDLEGMACGLIVMFAADLLFQSVHFGREKLDGASAIGTDHVVMTAAVVLMLVARNAIMKSNCAGQTTLC